MDFKAYCGICGYDTNHDQNGCAYHQKVLHDQDGIPYLRYEEFDQDGN